MNPYEIEKDGLFFHDGDESSPSHYERYFNALEAMIALRGEPIQALYRRHDEAASILDAAMIDLRKAMLEGAPVAAHGCHEEETER